MAKLWSQGFEVGMVTSWPSVTDWSGFLGNNTIAITTDFTSRVSVFSAPKIINGTGYQMVGQGYIFPGNDVVVASDNFERYVRQYGFLVERIEKTGRIDFFVYQIHKGKKIKRGIARFRSIPRQTITTKVCPMPHSKKLWPNEEIEKMFLWAVFEALKGNE